MTASTVLDRPKPSARTRGHGPSSARATAQLAASAPRRRTSLVHLRRRAVALIALVAVVFAFTVAIGRVGAEAELADPVAGHVVVAPGETLWDVAVETAPDGVDPRRQLASLRELNGLDGGHLDAWAVVLIPAR